MKIGGKSGIVKKSVGSILDPVQFVYRARRGVDGSKLFIFTMLEMSKVYAKLLCADFNSALNTLQYFLALRLISDFILAHRLILWILDFSTCRQSFCKWSLF